MSGLLFEWQSLMMLTTKMLNFSFKRQDFANHWVMSIIYVQSMVRMSGKNFQVKASKQDLRNHRWRPGVYIHLLCTGYIYNRKRHVVTCCCVLFDTIFLDSLCHLSWDEVPPKLCDFWISDFEPSSFLSLCQCENVWTKWAMESCNS